MSLPHEVEHSPQGPVMKWEHLRVLQLCVCAGRRRPILLQNASSTVETFASTQYTVRVWSPPPHGEEHADQFPETHDGHGWVLQDCSVAIPFKPAQTDVATVSPSLTQLRVRFRSPPPQRTEQSVHGIATKWGHPSTLHSSMLDGRETPALAQITSAT